MSNYQNWILLNKLEPAKIRALEQESIKGDKCIIQNKSDEPLLTWGQDHQSCDDYLWIRKLPKADLHCHIGSCIGPELLPVTATLVLSEKYKRGYPAKKKDRIKSILQFLLPVALDPYIALDPKIPNLETKETKSYKKTFCCDPDKTTCKSIFDIISNGLLDAKITPEVALLDPYDTTLERMLSPNSIKGSRYFKNKMLLRETKVTYDEIMLFFILLLSFRVNFKKQADDLYKYISKRTSELIFQVEDSIDPLIDLTEKDVEIFLETIKVILKENGSQEDLSALKIIESKKDINVLQFLQSANSALGKGKGHSLFNYLQGCEYGGAPHLQTRTSIYAVTSYIVNEYALEQNIRYLGLRCSVDGYSKMGIQTKEEALEALLRGFNFYCKKAPKKIHVDIILTAKRHKSLKEFEDNVRLALKYRKGLSLTAEKPTSESFFFPSPARVVSFDLAGLEKGNRPSKFLSQFMPLLRACFPITIHAGEEDDHESIWEAIYLVQSHRIGHGLTLTQNKNLLSLVRERHIAIELCPISNLLTQGDEILGKGKQHQDDKSCRHKYPLRTLLDENIDVTINTDNPFVNGANLTEDYLVGACLAGNLTKWEILRIIKNGFKATSIPKQEKRLLMDEIDAEIYEILLNED